METTRPTPDNQLKNLPQALCDLQQFVVHGTAEPTDVMATAYATPSQLAIMFADLAARLAAYGDHALPDGVSLMVSTVSFYAAVRNSEFPRVELDEKVRLQVMESLMATLIPGVEARDGSGSTRMAVGRTAAGLALYFSERVKPVDGDPT